MDVLFRTWSRLRRALLNTRLGAQERAKAKAEYLRRRFQVCLTASYYTMVSPRVGRRNKFKLSTFRKGRAACD
jgi:hypothetical protein